MKKIYICISVKENGFLLKIIETLNVFKKKKLKAKIISGLYFWTKENCYLYIIFAHLNSFKSLKNKTSFCYQFVQEGYLQTKIST